MKVLLYFLLTSLALSLTGCDHCIKLCQYNFDYVPLLQDNYCNSDSGCENFLREVSYRYLSGTIQNNPCIHDTRHKDCSSFSLNICSDLLQSSCSRGFLAVDEGMGRKSELKEQLYRLSQESEEIELEIKEEITKQKQKYLRILNKLSELQLEV
jgi:hypothetical protein